jgi:FtsZ-binding cell division protein ZapB
LAATGEQTRRPQNNGKKAVGVRDRVVTWLATAGPLTDASGMASTALAAAVEYPGTSIAFAQLLSGMERAGLIRREIRGKRTYRIELTDEGRVRATQVGQEPTSATERLDRRPSPSAAAPADGGSGPSPVPASIVPSSAALDYDELARRLLLQVAQRLAREEALQDPGTGGRTWMDRHVVSLERKLGELQRELARARSAREALEQENEALREQLERTRQNLETVESRLKTPRRPVPAPKAAELDEGELALLQRMLARPTGRRASGRASRTG